MWTHAGVWGAEETLVPWRRGMGRQGCLGACLCHRVRRAAGTHPTGGLLEGTCEQRHGFGTPDLSVS